MWGEERKGKTEGMLKRSRLGGVRDIATAIFTFRHFWRVTEWKGACLCCHACHRLPHLNCYFKAERGKWRNDTVGWGEIPETKKRKKQPQERFQTFITCWRVELSRRCVIYAIRYLNIAEAICPRLKVRRGVTWIQLLWVWFERHHFLPAWPKTS